MKWTSTSRRAFCGTLTAAAAAALWPGDMFAASLPFKLNYILASSLYGRLPLSEVVEAVRKTGAHAIDIWPEGHANHREQVEAIGHDAFVRMLRDADVRLGIYSCYNTGLLKSEKWMRVVKKLGGSMIIANGFGPAGLTGDLLKRQLRSFAEAIKPVIDLADELNLTIGVENHGGSLVSSPESIRRLVEIVPSPRVGVALAPYHLQQDAGQIARLIRDLGPRLAHFYAWEHGFGCMKKMPKVMEMKQMPGYGPLDFTPIVAALKEIDYQHGTSIFMHPVPRGIPILPTANQVTAAINRSREYLEDCLSRL